MNSIETNELTKVYSSSFGNKKVQALVDMNLSVENGTIFGLLGPNGAGKTTLVKLLLGITFPTFGSAKILGENISNYKIKSRVGYLPENHKYPPYLTGGEVLNFFGKLSGVDGNILDKKIDELLDMMKLLKWKKSKVKTYSKGMMQRLGLAQAMINDPDLIFLDEPTDGFSKEQLGNVREILDEIQSPQIIMVSHEKELESFADQIFRITKVQGQSRITT